MASVIKYIAVDDDLLDLLAVQEYCKTNRLFEKHGAYSSVNDALSAIETTQPDLLFLDIEMPVLNGMQLFRKIKELVPMVVFITSHPEFAIEGFELDAIDYILKPLTEERFQKTAQRIEQYWDAKNKAAAYEVIIANESLVIKEGHTQSKIAQSEIIYLEAMQDYTKVVTKSKNYMTLSSLTDFLDKLPANKFMRIHRSYAVSVNKISHLRNTELICGGIAIPIGKTYRSSVSSFKI